ncbi:cysteine desulfurase-like protein [Halomonas daqiaonensis]|uniref:Cysteine desulfurase family protein, VC1184 subfamily n=1 Tax=Halomonas daqiaonensis TaxID=650850 RepID=A0A1H7WDK1_9GAMM|nr:cysteine desulfurase-like protein [Halomonas daqiaonensis]SEM19656.1 cysteine desulfurase family protein, VC1184 subfamily [Halomonas daqiaonensis]
MSLDIDFVRSQFPSLQSEWVFMDNAGGAQVPQVVVDRISDYLLGDNVQLGASYAPSQRSKAKVTAGREAAKTLVNARHVEEMVFGPSSTIQFRLLADALASQFVPDDEIIVTNTDHESHVGPWVRLAAVRGAKIRFWNCNPDTLELDLDTLSALMSDRTKLVCIPHVSNLLGTINPIKRIAELVHAQGARLSVDGVAYAPHRAIDVQDWNVDYYGFSLYKVFGPHHAVLYVKKECLLELDNIYHYFFTKEQIPGKVEPGNPNYELTYSCTGILDYLITLGDGAGLSEDREKLEKAFHDIAAHEGYLGERLLRYLRGKEGVRIVGREDADIEHRVATISFVVEGTKSDEIVTRVDDSRVGIRFGDFYARRLAEDLDLMDINGVVRVSMVHYNTEEEVDRLIQALDAAI